MIPRTALTIAILAVGAAAQIAAPGRFAERRLRLPPGLGPAGPCVLADLDGDGLEDLVRASGTELAVLLQGPDGRFAAVQARIAFPAPATAITALAAAHVDGDPFVDLVVGLAGDDDAVLRGNGNGRLARAVPNPIPSVTVGRTAPTVILVGDFDQQHGADLILASPTGNTRVLYSTGSNLLAAPAALPIAARAPLRAALAIDLDGDSDLDLVCAPAGSTDTLVLENAGGVFTQRLAVSYPAGCIAGGRFGGGNALPDVLLLHASAAPQPPLVLDNRSRMAFQTRPLAWSIAAAKVAAADFDGSPLDDVLILETGGAVSLARDLQPPARVLEPEVRSDLAVADLEGDGDADAVVVGERPPDAVLLGDGAGRLLDTERPVLAGAPIAGRQVGVLVGSQRARDPHLLVYDGTGAPHYFENDAGAWFAPHARATAPSLAGFAVTSLAQAPVAQVGGDAIVALDPSRPGGLRFLSLRSTQDVVDSTSTVWSGVGWFTAVGVGSFAATGSAGGAADLVLADVLGGLHLYRLANGVYGEVANAFAGAGPFAAVTGLLVGRFDADALPDVCVLHAGGVAVLLGSGSSFHTVPAAATQVGPVDRGLAADLDGDGLDDLVLSTPGLPRPITVLRAAGDGTLLDVTAAALGANAALPAPSDLVLAGRGPRQVLLLGTSAGSVLAAPRSVAGGGAWFDPARPLPLHGTGPIVDLVCGDVDGDRDDDLVVLRAGLAPAVLLNRELQLTSLAVGQTGRRLELRLEGDPVDVVAVFLGFTRFRFDFEPFGVVRLADPISLLAVGLGPDGSFDLSLALPPAMQPLDLQLQLAAIRGVSGEAVLGNLQTIAVSAF